MNNEVINTRTLDVVAAEINALTASALSTVIEIGRRMVEAKAMLPHGEFLPWLEANTGYGKSTANNFMRLFEAYGDRQQSLFGAQVNSQTIGHLPYSKALALLAVPEEDRESFAAEVNASEISVKELKEAIRAKEEAEHRAKQAEHRAAEAEAAEEGALLSLGDVQEQLRVQTAATAKLQKKVDALEKQPPEIIVQEPKEEDVQARAQILLDKAQLEFEEELAGKEEELRRLRAKLTELETEYEGQVEALQKQADDAKKAADRAKADALRSFERGQKAAGARTSDLESEAATLRETIEDLQKQITMSDGAVSEFKVHFGLWQAEMQAMREVMERTNAETAAKLRTAISSVIAAWSEELTA